MGSEVISEAKCGLNQRQRVNILHSQRLVREILAAAVEQTGHCVAGLHRTAGELVEAVRSTRPDAVLLESSGGATMELISQLRSTHTSLRLLVLSTIEAGDPDRWRVAGASGILDVRTSGGGALAEAMAELASGRTFFPQAPPPRPDYPRTGVLGNLTAREVDVLRQVAAGLDNARIADLLAIGERTVKAHVSSLYRKLGQENRTELALLARRMNLGPESAL